MMSLSRKPIERTLSYISDLIFVRVCPVCGSVLSVDERHICAACMLDLPRTLMEGERMNSVEQLFAGKTPIERATGYFYYERHSRYASILHSLKYRNDPYLGEWLAGRFAAEIAQSGFFDAIDVVVPVPLHYTKLAQRGYNQSECIARGIARTIGVPVVKALRADKPHATQTDKSAEERYFNVQGIYSARHAERVEGKHVLLVDDVVTTGATLLSCALTLRSAAPGIKISIATLAVARLE